MVIATNVLRSLDSSRRKWVYDYIVTNYVQWIVSKIENLFYKLTY